MAAIYVTKEQKEESLRETAALKDWADRVARNYPDKHLYYPGERRREVRWWHWLGFEPKFPEERRRASRR